MRSRTSCIFFFFSCMILSIALATPCRAIELGDYIATGEIEAGWAFGIEEPSKINQGKFLEYYGDSRIGLVSNIGLQLVSKDGRYSHEIQASDIGQEIQQYSLRSSRTGLYTFEFEWDQIPHIYSSSVRFPDSEVRRGVYALPDPRPDLTTYNGSRLYDDVGVRWDSARVGMMYTPNPEWDIFGEYKFTSREGDKPAGLSFGEPWDNFREVLQPIEYTDHDASVSAALNRKDYQVRLSYNMSLFKNDLTSLIVDNPLPTTPERAQASLPPSNMANTVNLSAGWNLPHRTRINTSFSYGWRTQDEPFLPFTIDDNILATMNSPTFSQSSLNGDVQTMNFFLSGTGHPVDPLTIRASYRFYNLDDNTREFFIPEFVLNDYEVEDGGRLALRYPFSRHTANLDAKWQFQYPVTISAGYNWNRMDRDEGIVQMTPTVDEHTPRVVVDVKPLNWLLLSGTYSHTIRNTKDDRQLNMDLLPPNHPPIRTTTNCVMCHGGSNSNPLENDTGKMSQDHPPINIKTNCSRCHESSTAGITGAGGFSRNNFNMIGLNRDKADFSVEISPLDTLSLTGIFGLAYEDYDQNETGLLNSDNWSAGIEMSWRPLPRVSVNAGYVHENSEIQQITDGWTVEIDPGPFLTTTENIDTFTAGTKVVLIPQKLDWDTRASYSKARSDFHNPELPKLDEEYTHVSTYLRYYFLKSWTLKVGYIYETFDLADDYWRYSVPRPPNIEDNSVFLGDYYRDYTAHIIAASLRYKF